MTHIPIPSLEPLDRFDEMPLYRQVELQIENLIRSRKLQPHEALPSLSVLTRELGVNHLTIRRAIRELAQRHVVVTRQGRGTFVAEGVVRKVLWVCGLDIFSGDISSYYTDLLRFTSQSLSAQDISIEPAWLTQHRPEESHRYTNKSSSRGYVGYLFSAARKHPLLDYVAANGLPHVNVSFVPLTPSHSVTHNVAGADRLALCHLASQGHKQISLLGFPVKDEPWLSDLQRELGIELQISVEYTPDGSSQRTLDVETTAYNDVSALLASGRLCDAVYISDEIGARGATRAILAHRDREHWPQIVVRSAKQNVIPLGLPVTYVVFDVKEQAREAVNVLMDQINGIRDRPDHHLCEYQLMNQPVNI